MTPEDHARYAGAGAPVRADTTCPRLRDQRLARLAEHVLRDGRAVREEQTLVELEEDLRAAADSPGR